MRRSVYLIPMARRLLAFTLALNVVGAPVVANICEAFCARHPAHESAWKEIESHHYYHQTPLTEKMTALDGVRHGCWHLVAVTASREANRSEAKVTAVAAGVATVVRELAFSAVVDSRHGPPFPIRLLAPLRI